jgi:serine/threonine-protein kinase
MTAQYQASEIPNALLPQTGNVVGGKYRIDGFIARGGMGAVLAATHAVTGRRVALKWLLPQVGQDAEATHRVLREARAAARVRHPNVVDVYDVGEHDGALFLVMELLEGETLHARLKAGGALDPRAVLTLLLPAMRGVEAAHQSGVIHRDLKPSNIFLCREHGASEPTPRVLDFGISKVMSAAGDGEHSLTRTGAVLGTPHYMPAEQLTGGDADETADVYALGVILYQCLTGQLPFEETNYNALVMQIGAATPRTVAELAPRVPAPLSAVVMRAMARERRDRFQNVGALIAELLSIRSDVSSARAPRRAASLWAIALATCALAGVAAWASQRDEAPERPAPIATQPTRPPESVRSTTQLAQGTPQVEPTPQVGTAAAAAPRQAQPVPVTRATAPRTTQRAPARSRPGAPLPPSEPPGAPRAQQPVPVSLEQF